VTSVPQGYPHDYYVAALADDASDSVAWAVYRGSPHGDHVVCVCRDREEAVRRALTVAAYMRTTGTASCAKIFDEIVGEWTIVCA